LRIAKFSIARLQWCNTRGTHIIESFIEEVRVLEQLMTSGFWSALAAIVLIDLVLAGDNAIVIALAARRLPAALRRRAIVTGTLAAICVRAALTVLIVWLLGVPGLMLAGGLLLLWIAYRLLTEQGEGAHDVDSSPSYWGAMRTIVIADGVMGLDNMLAVAGAAQGSTVLVIAGLAISIPVMVWGSRLIMGMIERLPALLYVGGAVLAWTAAKMIGAEPWVADRIAEHRWATWAMVIGAVAGVLGAAWLRNRRAMQTAVAAR
jgi:YjbE family integral membrane protein